MFSTEHWFAGQDPFDKDLHHVRRHGSGNNRCYDAIDYVALVSLFEIERL